MLQLDDDSAIARGKPDREAFGHVSGRRRTLLAEHEEDWAVLLEIGVVEEISLRKLVIVEHIEVILLLCELIHVGVPLRSFLMKQIRVKIPRDGRDKHTSAYLVS